MTHSNGEHGTPDPHLPEHSASRPPAFPPGTGYPYPVPPYDPLVAYDFSGWIDRLVGVVKRSWKRLLGLFVIGYLLPVAAVVLVIFGLVFGSTLTADQFGPVIVVPLVAGIVVAAIYFYLVTLLAAVKIATNDAAGQPIRMVDAYRSSWSLGWPTLGWAVAAGFLIFLGLLMCLLPGIYLAIAFSLLVPAMAFQRQNGLAESLGLVNSNFWPVVGRLVMLYGVTTAISLGVQTAMEQASLPITGIPESGELSLAVTPILAVLTVLGMIVSLAVDLVIEVIVLAGLVVTYAELRGRRQPGLTTAQLAAEVNGLNTVP